MRMSAYGHAVKRVADAPRPPAASIRKVVPYSGRAATSASGRARRWPPSRGGRLRGGRDRRRRRAREPAPRVGCLSSRSTTSGRSSIVDAAALHRRIAQSRTDGYRDPLGSDAGTIGWCYKVWGSVAERLTVGRRAARGTCRCSRRRRRWAWDRSPPRRSRTTSNINATQIRRDLSAFGKFGKRGVGYNIDSLLGEIRRILRTQGQHNIALVGAGRSARRSRARRSSPSTGSTSRRSSTSTRTRSAARSATTASRTTPSSSGSCARRTSSSV